MRAEPRDSLRHPGRYHHFSFESRGSLHPLLTVPFSQFLVSLHSSRYFVPERYGKSDGTE